MSQWTKLGLNCQEEWIEENPLGLRRVLTSVGYINEGEADIRWGRISSSGDAKIMAESLSYSHIFKSYASLDALYSIWSAPFGAPIQQKKCPADFRKLLEVAMARRIWDAARFNRWSSSLPDWKPSLNRQGPGSWPLCVDIGLMKRISGLSNFDLDRYTQWLSTSQSQNQLTISQRPDSQAQFVVEGWFIKYEGWAKDTQQRVTSEQWCGSKPPSPEVDVWEDQYRAFSNVKHEPSGYVSPLLNQALRRARPDQSAAEVRSQVAGWMGVGNETLSDLLSDDQVDAVWLAYQQLEQGKSFLLADETGYGKGRILAALAKIALHQDVQVLFFTEKKTLLSDFYRDCLILFGEVPAPVVMHSTAKVLSPQGTSALGKDQYRPPQKGDAWVWTTYSQFNRNNPEKLSAVTKWMGKKTWVLMDEAHRAAGASNTSKALAKIQSKSHGVLFSSATYAKNEDQLLAYRHLFDGDAQQWRRLMSAFASDSDTLRSAITLMWAEKGIFLRREHPPMALPQPCWLALDENKMQEISTFAKWWTLMHQCSVAWSLEMNKSEGAWTRLGGHLSRASREFSILQKTDFLVQQVEEDIRNQIKPVIVADWTLSSHVARLLDVESESGSEEDNDGEEPRIDKERVFDQCPTWRDSWAKIIMEIFADADVSYMRPASRGPMKLLRQQVVDCLADLPSWSVSPFDDLHARLQNKGIGLAELSGRSWSLVEEDAQWKIIPRSKENRSILVNQFNSGQHDAIVITRAGNSGLSLHAGKTFADQKKRHLIEWDVAPDPSVRLQFWGRVRRKDQVSEPLRSTLLVDTAFERRRQHRDDIKQKKILSHSGNASNGQDTSWIGESGSFVAREWISNHPYAGDILEPWPDANVEKMLARSVVLPAADRNSLMQHLDVGVGLLSDWSKSRLPQWNGPSRSVRKHWWWGQGEQSLYWEERVWAPRLPPSKEEVFSALASHASGQSKAAQEVMLEWGSVWKEWWRLDPAQATPTRRQMLSWWQTNAQHFERGQGLSVKDPHTGQRALAVILGWRAPRSGSPQDWSASQISLVAWLNTMDEPMELSLSAWMSPSFGGAKVAGAPKTAWFSLPSAPVRALTLVGPPWSVSAWGARHGPRGELMHLHDEQARWSWGWRMPSWWGWENMLSTHRELAGVAHALAFLRAHGQSAITWRWSPHHTIEATAQPGGLMLSGKSAALDLLSFPIQQRCGRLTWDQSRTQWFTLLPWSAVAEAFHHWFSAGATPTVPASYATWVARSWKDSSQK